MVVVYFEEVAKLAKDTEEKYKNLRGLFVFRPRTKNCLFTLHICLWQSDNCDVSENIFCHLFFYKMKHV